jgi:general secretion pathway protein D
MFVTLVEQARPSGVQPAQAARSNSTCIALLLLTLLALTFPATSFAESAGSLYNKGQKAEARQQWEAAYQYYKGAYDKKSDSIRYRAAYERSRFNAAAVKVKRGQMLRAQDKFQEALAEFQNALAIDPGLEIATQEINATKAFMESGGQPGGPGEPNAPQPKVSQLLSEAQGPVELEAITNQPITLKMTEDSKVIYETIGKLAGINVLFDPDYTSRRIHIELNNVGLQDALQIVALESRTFWRAVTKNTIFVAADNQQKRRELEENVVRTFYLSNVATTTDLQDVVNAMRTVLELQRIQQLPSQDAIVIRGTPDQLALAEKLIGDLDKPRPEVVVDIAVMQVARNKALNLGISPPTSASVQIVPVPSGQNMTFGTFKSLGSSNYQVTLGAANAQLLFSDADTQIIQNPQIRALDGQKASLKIGDRVPVATGSFGFPTGVVGTGVGGFNGTVNTQFQYIDVGVNIDVTPNIHADGDVTLKIMIDISSVTDHVNIGGIDQPVIGQRKIEHEIRLREGEVNLMGGIFEDQEVKSLSGLPGLSKIPLFKYLFSQTNRSSQKNEIVFVMIPHIVRHQAITPLNTKALDIGTGTAIELRHAPATPATQTAPAPNAQPVAQQPQTAPPQTSAPGQNPSPQQNQPQTQNQPPPQPQAEANAPPSPTEQAQPEPQSQPNAPPNPQNSGVPSSAQGQGEQQQQPQQPTAISFSPPSLNQMAGTTAAINVLMQSGAAVSAVSMQLRYDQRLLQLLNVANGGFLSQDGQPATVVHRDDGAGTLQVSAVRPPGAPGISGQGTLFTLVFQLKAAGSASLVPLSLMTRDANGNPVLATTGGPAAIQINPPNH